MEAALAAVRLEAVRGEQRQRLQRAMRMGAALVMEHCSAYPAHLPADMPADQREDETRRFMAYLDQVRRIIETAIAQAQEHL